MLLPWILTVLALASPPQDGTPHSTQEAAPATQEAAPVWSVLPPSGGRIEDLEGARVLHLSGSLLERGFAEGYLMADEILACFREYALGEVTAGKPLLWDFMIRPVVLTRFTFEQGVRD